MKKALIASLVALGAAGIAPAIAQDAAQPAPAAEAAAQAGPTALTDDPAMIELGAKVVAASRAARVFDELLPNIADRVKQTYIQSNPQMQLGIIEVVDQVALKLVERRPELDQKLAQIWATAFSKEELETILAFYESEAGKKFAVLQPRLLAVQMAAGDQWSRAIGDMMMREVKAELDKRVAGEVKGLQGATQPAAAPQQ